MKKTFDWSKEYWKQCIIFAAIIVIVGLFIIVCRHAYAIQPKEGVVVRKDYNPAYTTTSYRTITHSDGKTTSVPVQEQHAAVYQITIKGINSKGEESLGYYYVTPVEYENIKIGDYYIKQLE